MLRRMTTPACYGEENWYIFSVKNEILSPWRWWMGYLKAGKLGNYLLSLFKPTGSPRRISNGWLRWLLLWKEWDLGLGTGRKESYPLLLIITTKKEKKKKKDRKENSFFFLFFLTDGKCMFVRPRLHSLHFVCFVVENWLFVSWDAKQDQKRGCEEKNEKKKKKRRREKQEGKKERKTKKKKNKKMLNNNDNNSNNDDDSNGNSSSSNSGGKERRTTVSQSKGCRVVGKPETSNMWFKEMTGIRQSLSLVTQEKIKHLQN